MVLSMNSIPKYDIADIVSQISGKMQPADAPSPEGQSFADLLKEAIKSIPESNAEANVAESGRSMPQSPLSEKAIKSQLAGKGVNETELHTLLRQVFLDDSQELAPEVKTDVGEIHRTQLESRENSDLLAKLRAALNYRTSGPAELDGDSRVSDVNDLVAEVKLSSLSPQSAEDRIRVATLKERRPVLLGPGSYIDELKSQVMANYLSEEGFSSAQQANSQNSAQLDKAVFLAGNVKETTKQFEGKNEVATDLKFNFDENSTSTNQFTFQRVEADVLNKEYKEGNAGIAKEGNAGIAKEGNAGIAKASAEHITFVSAEARKTDQESQFHNARREPGHAHNGEVIGEYSNRDGSAQKEILPLTSSSMKQSDLGQKELHSRVLNATMQPTAEYAIANNTKELGKDVSQVGALRDDENQRIPAGEDQGNSKDKFVSKNPQEFDQKIGAYFEGYDKFKSVQTQTLDDSQNKSSAGDNVLRQYELQSNVDRQNKSAPAVVLESQRKLKADADRKPANGELRQGFGVENFEPTKNSLKIGGLEPVIQIQREEYLKSSDVNNQMIPPADVDLTLEETVSSINNPKGERLDSLGPELFAHSQSDKPMVSNRTDLNPRTVAVSNFNSGIQEAIMGQLTKTSSGTSKFTVALFPENLGKISIEISYSDLAGLKITMVGDNPEATKILEQNLPTLRENLQTDKLNELLVNLNANKDSSGSNQKYSQSGEDTFMNKEDRDVGALELTDSKSETHENGDTSDPETGLDTYV